MATQAGFARCWRIAIPFLAVLAATSLAPYDAIGSPSVVWSPASVNTTLAPGGSQTLEVTFRASERLGDVIVRVVPALVSLVGVTPSAIAGVGKGQVVMLRLTLAVPTDMAPGTVDGTIQVRAGTGKSANDLAPALPVVLQVSGPLQRLVPNVVGMTQADAEAAITSALLTVGAITNANSLTAPAGSVISESPEAGTSVPQGSAVDLVVSSGPPVVAVPNVVGMTQAIASSTITSAHLVVGTVTTAGSSTVPAGNVISQSPEAGTSVAEESAVDLLVSSGSASWIAISSIDPPSASFLSRVTIQGRGFGTDRTAVRVRFSFSANGESLVIDQPVLAATDTLLDLAVPLAIPNQVNQVQVIVGGEASPPVDYLVGSLPWDPTPDQAGNEAAAFIDQIQELIASFDARLDPWFVQTNAMSPEEAARQHQTMTQIHDALLALRAQVLGNDPQALRFLDMLMGSEAFGALRGKLQDAIAALHGSPQGTVLCEGQELRDQLNEMSSVLDTIVDIVIAVRWAARGACAAATIGAILTFGGATGAAVAACTIDAVLETVGVDIILSALEASSVALEAIADAAPNDPLLGTYVAQVAHPMWGGEPTVIYVNGSTPAEVRAFSQFHNASCEPSGCEKSFDIDIKGITIPIDFMVSYTRTPPLPLTSKLTFPAGGFLDLGPSSDEEARLITGTDVNGPAWERGAYTISVTSTCGSDPQTGEPLTLGPADLQRSLVSGPRLSSVDPTRVRWGTAVDLDGDFMPPLARNDARALFDHSAETSMISTSTNHYALVVPDAAEGSNHIRLRVNGCDSNTLPFTVFPDADRDELTDFEEALLGTDPNNPETDGDGLSDGDEVRRGTNPLAVDTDGDGLWDGIEVRGGSNPLFNPAAAVATGYGFTLIAATSPCPLNGETGGFRCSGFVSLSYSPYAGQGVIASSPSINNAGEVAFWGLLGEDSPTPGEGIFVGSGGGVSPVDLGTYRAVYWPDPSINDSGTVSFTKVNYDIPMLELHAGGTIVATSWNFGSMFPAPWHFTYGDTFPTINNQGEVVFQVQEEDEFNRPHRVLLKGTRPTDLELIAEDGAGTPPFVLHGGDFPEACERYAINDAGTVVFGAYLIGAPSRFGGTILSGTGTPGCLDISCLGSYTSIAGPALSEWMNAYNSMSINNSGTVAFMTLLNSGDTAILIGDGSADATPVVLAGPSHPFFNVVNVSINNWGKVAFDGTDTATGGGIFTGPDPVADKVIGDVDSLDGLVTYLGGRWGSSRKINDNGQIVFFVWQETGDPQYPSREAIYRADPLYLPVAAPDVASTTRNAPVDIAVLANDSDPNGDPLRVIGITQPANGTAVINSDGTIRYTPNPDFTGLDTFTSTITDDSSGSATGTVKVIVE